MAQKASVKIARKKPAKIAKPRVKKTAARAAVKNKARPTSSHQPSKKETVLALLRRKSGASIAELQDATGWQAHSVRGFLSGTVKKRLGLALAAKTDDNGDRRYHVGAAS